MGAGQNLVQLAQYRIAVLPVPRMPGFPRFAAAIHLILWMILAALEACKHVCHNQKE
jgi:hypothetical protein